MKASVFSLLFILISFLANAQAEIEMADQFRADGKIYVVIAVVSIILAGLFVYLFRLDRKVTNLENRLK
ncbi:CcmD family protein [Aquirufa sp. OSTEICH-129V]|uniref:CcmD family protein n=1 Tax=Aquirufa avitistagni TaxID=3104728 RepID=A0ABW6DDB9_9BACT